MGVDDSIEEADLDVLTTEDGVGALCTCVITMVVREVGWVIVVVFVTRMTPLHIALGDGGTTDDKLKVREGATTEGKISFQQTLALGNGGDDLDVQQLKTGGQAVGNHQILGGALRNGDENTVDNFFTHGHIKHTGWVGRVGNLVNTRATAVLVVNDGIVMFHITIEHVVVGVEVLHNADLAGDVVDRADQAIVADGVEAVVAIVELVAFGEATIRVEDVVGKVVRVIVEIQRAILVIQCGVVGLVGCDDVVDRCIALDEDDLTGGVVDVGDDIGTTVKQDTGSGVEVSGGVTDGDRTKQGQVGQGAVNPADIDLQGDRARGQTAVEVKGAHGLVVVATQVGIGAGRLEQVEDRAGGLGRQEAVATEGDAVELTVNLLDQQAGGGLDVSGCRGGNDGAGCRVNGDLSVAGHVALDAGRIIEEIGDGILAIEGPGAWDNVVVTVGSTPHQCITVEWQAAVIELPVPEVGPGLVTGVVDRVNEVAKAIVNQLEGL